MTMCEIFVELLTDFIIAWLAFWWGYYKGGEDEVKLWNEWLNRFVKKQQGCKHNDLWEGEPK